MSNLPGVNGNAVAEYAMSLLLAAAREVLAALAGRPRTPVNHLGEK